MKQGKFITLEGGDGSGKSTQAKKLAEYLTSLGNEVILTREPGGTQGALSIRTLLVEGEPERWDAVSETLLHFAARRDHVERLIKPALARGAWVISDRFTDSTLAYQAYGLGVDKALIEILAQATHPALTPNLTFILDLPEDAALTRAIARKENIKETRYEKRGQAFHARVRQGFLEIAKQHDSRCRVINAALTPEQVFEEIKHALPTS